MIIERIQLREDWFNRFFLVRIIKSITSRPAQPGTVGGTADVFNGHTGNLRAWLSHLNLHYPAVNSKGLSAVSSLPGPMTLDAISRNSTLCPS